jgi:hypothetical protein
MDSEASTKMPKPFDSHEDLAATSHVNSDANDEDRLKQEEDYRQGNTQLCDPAID